MNPTANLGLATSANASASTSSSTSKKKTITQSENTGKGIERLEVTVIPVNEEPYPKQVQIPQSLIGKLPAREFNLQLPW